MAEAPSTRLDELMFGYLSYAAASVGGPSVGTPGKQEAPWVL